MPRKSKNNKITDPVDDQKTEEQPITPVEEQSPIEEIPQTPIVPPSDTSESESEDLTPKEQEKLSSLTQAELENLVYNTGSTLSEDDQTVETDHVAEVPIVGKEYDNVLGGTEEEREDTPISKELEHEREVNRMSTKTNFLKEYSKATGRSVEEVADKLGVSFRSAKEYINEYINVVKQSIKDKDYPDSVLFHYNQYFAEGDAKRIKLYHVEKLKDVVKRYSQFDVSAHLGGGRMNGNKTLNNDGNDRFISNKQVAHNQRSGNPFTDFDGPGVNNAPYPDDFGPSAAVPYHEEPAGTALPTDIGDMGELRYNITALQLIKHGLYNTFGQVPMRKMLAMIGPDPTAYLMDEQKFHNLLRLGGLEEYKVKGFIEWLKIHASHVQYPIGFLDNAVSQAGPRMGMVGGGGGGSGSGAHGNYGQGTQYDMSEYYYQIGVFIPGLPPDHPVNRENLMNYRKEKREQDELKALDRKAEMAMRYNMFKMFGSMGGEGGDGGGGGMFGTGGGGGRRSLFSPEMLILTGMGRYERTGTDEQGNPIYGIVPNLGYNPNNAMGGANNPNGVPGQTPQDSVTSAVNMVKELMQTMTIIQSQTQGKQNEVMDKILGGMVNRILEPPQQKSELDDFVKTFDVITKLRGDLGGSGGQQDPRIILETQRLENERDFGMKSLEMQATKMKMEQQAREKSEEDASKSLNMLVSGLEKVVNPLINLGSQFLFAKGGGAGAAGPMGMLGPMSPGVENPLLATMTGGGDPGMGGGGGPMPTAPGPLGGGALSKLVEMEYNRDMQRMKEQDAQKQAEWQKVVQEKEAAWREANAEYLQEAERRKYATMNPNGYQPQQPDMVNTPFPAEQYPYTAPDYGTTHVEQPTNKPMAPGGLQNQEITLETFRPHPIDKIASNLEIAKEQIRFLENYVATGEETIQEKINNGETPARAAPSAPINGPIPMDTGYAPAYNDPNNKSIFEPDPNEYFDPALHRPQNLHVPSEQRTKQPQQEPEPNPTEYLDNYTAEGLDPDYEGPSSAGGETKEVNISAEQNTMKDDVTTVDI